MIRVEGSIFLDDALKIEIDEDLTGTDSEYRDYSVRVAVRDADGDHLYQRTLNNVPRNTNILGLLQILLDELPSEAQLSMKGVWVPSKNDPPLELT